MLPMKGWVVLFSTIPKTLLKKFVLAKVRFRIHYNIRYHNPQLNLVSLVLCRTTINLVHLIIPVDTI